MTSELIKAIVMAEDLKRLIELGELPDDALQELRAHGLEDHLAGSDQDA